MCIDSKNYKYYTIIDISESNQDVLGEDDSDCGETIDSINWKFKTSKDKNLNFRAYYTRYTVDIEWWTNNPVFQKYIYVFVQYQDNQKIKLTGSGQIFLLYQVDNNGICIDNTFINAGYPDHEGYDRRI